MLTVTLKSDLLYGIFGMKINLLSHIMVERVRLDKRHFEFSNLLFNKCVVTATCSSTVTLPTSAFTSCCKMAVCSYGRTFAQLKAIRFLSGSIKIGVNFGPRPSTGAHLGLELSFPIQKKLVDNSLLKIRTPQFFKETGCMILAAFSN